MHRKLPKVKRRDIICIEIYVLSLIFLKAFDTCFTTQINNAIGIIVMALSVYSVYKSKDNYLLLILSGFIAYSNYSIVMGIYWDPALRPMALYKQINDVNVYGIGISLLALFMLMYVYFLPRIIKKVEKPFGTIFVTPQNYNLFLYLGALVTYILIMIFAYSRVGTGRGASSPIYEYNTIFMVLMFYYCGDKKVLRFINIICAVAYILTSMLNGTRIEALTCLIIVFLCIQKRKLPMGWLLAISFLGMLCFNFVGMFRGDYIGQTEGVRRSLEAIVQQKLTFDTCLHAYFPMLAVIRTFRTYSLTTGMYFWGRFVFSIFLGQARVPDSNLISYVRQLYYHNNGCVSVGMFYAWFSYLGPLIFSLFVRFYVALTNNMEKNNHSIQTCAILYVVATVPRWYLYGPWAITRGVLLCVMVFWMFLKLNGLMRKSTDRR